MMAIIGMFFPFLRRSEQMAINCHIFEVPSEVVRPCNWWEGRCIAGAYTHGLRDRLGGRSFKPRALSFFFLQGVGFGAMASPSSVCLGCRSVCSLSWSFLLSFFAYLVSFLGGVRLSVLVLLSALCGFSLLFVVLLPLAGAHVVGGFLRRVVMYVAVSVSSLLLRFASKKAREVLPCAMHACFFFSLSRPLASCPCCFCYAVLVCFLMHAHAQRRRPLGLGFTSSCVAALLSQDPPSVLALLTFPGLGSCYPHHG